MLKRIMAWVLLIGFVFLIFNIIVFGFYWQLSVIIYLVIAFGFLFTNRRESMNGARNNGYEGESSNGDDQDNNNDNT